MWERSPLTLFPFKPKVPAFKYRSVLPTVKHRRVFFLQKNLPAGLRPAWQPTLFQSNGYAVTRSWWEHQPLVTLRSLYRKSRLHYMTVNRRSFAGCSPCTPAVQKADEGWRPKSENVVKGLRVEIFDQREKILPVPWRSEATHCPRRGESCLLSPPATRRVWGVGQRPTSKV